ncbi:MAG: LptA/OstA family protein [Puniceicoccales bacterium]|jgi:lipopolysaccharide export system protein LptA|nr:LptA/OstA family protein [Puniceicoccales bacterium]
MFKFFLKKYAQVFNKLRLFLFFFALSSSILAEKNLKMPFKDRASKNLIRSKTQSPSTPKPDPMPSSVSLAEPHKQGSDSQRTAVTSSVPLSEPHKQGSDSQRTAVTSSVPLAELHKQGSDSQRTAVTSSVPLAEPHKQGSESQGTAVTSNKLEVSFNGDQMEFSFIGNVKLNSPEFSAECAIAKVITFENSPKFPTSSEFLLEFIKQISITGPMNLKYGERTCSADRAEITTADSTIVLSGRATVKDAMGVVSGHEIRINYKTKSVEILGDKDKDPVIVSVTDTSQGAAKDKSTFFSNRLPSPTKNTSADNIKGKN